MPPAECRLRSARARVLLLEAQKRIKLTVRYTSFTPARVDLGYRLSGGRGSLKLPSAHPRFGRKGVFRLDERLGAAAMRKARAAGRVTVTMRIPAAPRQCHRYEARRLTIRRLAHKRIAWLQSGSPFGTPR